MKNKISIIGAGNVGAAAAHLVLQKALASVVLLDVVEGVPQGKALDLAQSSFIEGFEPCILGTNDFKDIKDSDIVLVTAGLPRKPGMDRIDLLKKNAEIINGIVKNIIQYCPNSIIVMMTNPMDILTYYAWKISGLERNRVIGQGGILDTARFCYFLSQESESTRDAIVVGGHDDTMQPLFRQPVSDEKRKAIIEKTRKGGAQIVSLLKTSAWLAPGAAACKMIEAILTDSKETLPVSCCLEGEYGIKDICIGVPAILGRNGIEKIIEIDLTDDERNALQNSASIYKESIRNILP